MTITAKFSGTCRICHGPIASGEKIEWVAGQRPAHPECAANPRGFTGRRAPAPDPAPSRSVQSEYAGRTTGPRRNRRPGPCSVCGAWVSPGQGTIYRCWGSSSNCNQHWDEDGGWHVVCPQHATKEAETK